MKIAMFLYDKMTALDFVGPFQVFAVMPGIEVLTVAKKAGPIDEDSGLHLLNAKYGIDDVDEADVLCLPGGVDNTHVQTDKEVIDWIKKIDAKTKWTTSVCTGSLILGAAGLLKGVRATTHWAALPGLEAFGAIPIKERVVSDGKYLSGGGVTAGIDMALTLLAKEFDDKTAQAIQLAIEYNPQPPFDTGSPEKAPQDIQDMVIKLFTEGAEQAQRPN